MGTEKTPEQQVIAFREAIVQVALDNDLSFNVIFTALSQTVAAFLLDYSMFVEGELDEEAVGLAVDRFASQLGDVAMVGFNNFKANAPQRI